MFCAIITVTVPYISDPYNVFHAENIRDNGVEPNKNYIKMRYILSHPDRFDSFIFGSSRVAALNAGKFEGEKCYNMTYSDGLPSEHLDNIRTMLSHGVKPKKVYIGLDSLSYSENPYGHIQQEMRCPYEYLDSHPLHFLKLYLNPALFPSALAIASTHTPVNGFVESFYETGSLCLYNVESSYDWTNPAPYIGAENHMDEVLGILSETAKLCRNEGIELVLFTNPMYSATYLESLEKGWLEFLIKLSYIAPFYHFSGLNKITADPQNFIDNAHYRPEVGDIMVGRMTGAPEIREIGGGFGVYVTRENADYFIESLK